MPPLGTAGFLIGACLVSWFASLAFAETCTKSNETCTVTGQSCTFYKDDATDGLCMCPIGHYYVQKRCKTSASTECSSSSNIISTISACNITDENLFTLIIGDHDEKCELYLKLKPCVLSEIRKKQRICSEAEIVNGIGNHTNTLLAAEYSFIPSVDFTTINECRAKDVMVELLLKEIMWYPALNDTSSPQYWAKRERFQKPVFEMLKYTFPATFVDTIITQLRSGHGNDTLAEVTLQLTKVPVGNISGDINKTITRNSTYDNKFRVISAAIFKGANCSVVDPEHEARLKYHHGNRYTVNDPCSRCFCNNGTTVCTSMTCKNVWIHQNCTDAVCMTENAECTPTKTCECKMDHTYNPKTDVCDDKRITVTTRPTTTPRPTIKPTTTRPTTTPRPTTKPTTTRPTTTPMPTTKPTTTRPTTTPRPTIKPTTTRPTTTSRPTIKPTTTKPTTTPRPTTKPTTTRPTTTPRSTTKPPTTRSTAQKSTTTPWPSTPRPTTPKSTTQRSTTTPTTIPSSPTPVTATLRTEPPTRTPPRTSTILPRRGLGDTCARSEECVNSHAICVGQKCNCKPPYSFATGETRCLSDLHGPCDVAGDCRQTDTNCITNTCKCTDDSYETGRICRKSAGMVCSNRDYIIKAVDGCGIDATVLMPLLVADRETKCSTYLWMRSCIVAAIQTVMVTCSADEITKAAGRYANDKLTEFSMPAVNFTDLKSCKAARQNVDLKLDKKVWNPELANPASPQFWGLKDNINSMFYRIYKEAFPKTFVDMTIKGFRKGSVIAEVTLQLTEAPTGNVTATISETIASSPNYSTEITFISVSVSTGMSCTFEEVEYTDGEKYHSIVDTCKRCFCDNGQTVCASMSCTSVWINEACGSDSMCGTQHAECKSNVCQCKDGYQFVAETATCIVTSPEKKAIGEQCANTAECIENAKCGMGGTCQCMQMFSQSSSGSCVARGSVGLVGDSCMINSQCSANMICQEMKCECTSFAKQMNKMCYVESMLGDTCRMDDQCDKNMVCVAMKCACVPNASPMDTMCELDKHMDKDDMTINIIIAVVCVGVGVIIIAAVVICCIRYRKKNRNTDISQVGGYSNNGYVDMSMYGRPAY